MNGLLYALRRYSVCLVVCYLLCPASFGLIDSTLHGIGDRIGIHYDVTVSVSCSPANGLDKRSRAAKETLLICIEYCNKTDFGDIQAFAKKIYTDQYIEFTESEVSNNLHSLNRFYIGMHVSDADADRIQMLCQHLRHALCQRRCKHSVTLLSSFPDLTYKVIYLTRYRPHIDLRINQSCRSDYLFGNVLRS